MKLAILCLCLLQAVVANSSVTTRDNIKNIDYDVPSKHRTSKETEFWSQGRPRTLFARRGVYDRQRLRVAKPKVTPTPPKKAPAPPALRCSKVMEICVPYSHCCDPCASCHCRFFNTICHCWKIGPHCQKKI